MTITDKSIDELKDLYGQLQSRQLKVLADLDDAKSKRAARQGGRHNIEARIRALGREYMEVSHEMGEINRAIHRVQHEHHQTNFAQIFYEVCKEMLDPDVLITLTQEATLRKTRALVQYQRKAPAGHGVTFKNAQFVR